MNPPPELIAIDHDDYMAKYATPRMAGSSFSPRRSSPPSMAIPAASSLRSGNYMAFHEPWDSGEYDT